MSIKVKLLRLITKRPYGLARMRVGRTWYSKIIRFDKDSFTWYDGKYIIEKNAVVIEKGAGNRKIYDLKEWSNYTEGFPVVYFDANNAKPLVFERNPLDNNLPTAHAIQATIKKEIAAFEAEMLRKQRSKLQTLMIITLVFAAMAFFASAYTVIKVASLAGHA